MREAPLIDRDEPGRRGVDDPPRVAVHHVARSSYRRLRVRPAHPHWAISHVVVGAVTTATRGLAWPVPAGSVMVHPPRIAYREDADAAGTHDWMLFDALGPGGVDLLRQHPVAPVVALRDPRGFRRLFDGLLAAWYDDAAPARDLAVAALAARAVHEVIASWLAAGAPPRPTELLDDRDRFTGLVAHLAANLHRRIPRDELAALAGVHPNHLDRAFRRHHGASPTAWLRRLRLARARELLETTARSVDDIGRACGFGDRRWFLRAFRAASGVSPAAWRSRVRRARASYAAPLPEADPRA